MGKEILNKELIKSPHLIQTYQLDFVMEKMIPNFMGNDIEFESGSQIKSMKRLFRAGMVSEEIKVRIYDVDRIPFYLISKGNLGTGVYSNIITDLIADKITQASPIDLQEGVLGVLKGRNGEGETNVWFDFTNDVFFTPFKNVAEKLMPILLVTKKKWEIKENRAKSSRK
jgi:hypothetical protein